MRVWVESEVCVTHKWHPVCDISHQCSLYFSSRLSPLVPQSASPHKHILKHANILLRQNIQAELSHKTIIYLFDFHFHFFRFWLLLASEGSWTLEFVAVIKIKVKRGEMHRTITNLNVFFQTQQAFSLSPLSHWRGLLLASRWMLLLVPSAGKHVSKMKCTWRRKKLLLYSCYWDMLTSCFSLFFILCSFCLERTEVLVFDEFSPLS